MRSAMRKNAVRVQFSPMPLTTTREPGTSVAAATMNAADEGSPGTTISSSSSSSTWDTVRRPSVALERHARAAQHALGVVAARRRLDHRGRAVGQHAGDQHARLDLGARHRQDVLDAGQLGAADRERREAPVAGLHPGAHAPQRLGHPVHRPAADRLVAVERPHPPGLPGEPAGQQPHQRAELPTSISPPVASSGACSPTPRISTDAVAVLVHPRAEALQARQRGRGVGRLQVVAHRHRLVRHRGEQRGAVRDRLVRRAACRCPGAGPRARSARGGLTARRRGSRARRSAGAARAASPSPAIQSVMAPVAHVGSRRERQVHDVHPRLAERQRHAGDDTGAVRDGEAQLVDGPSRQVRLEQPRGGPRGPRRSRRPRRRRLRAARPTASSERAKPRTSSTIASRFARYMSAHMAVLAPATRVASRKLGPDLPERLALVEQPPGRLRGRARWPARAAGG